MNVVGAPVVEFPLIRTVERTIGKVSENLRNWMNKKRQFEFVDLIFGFHQNFMRLLVMTRYLKFDHPYIKNVLVGSQVLLLNILYMNSLGQGLVDFSNNYSIFRALPYEIEAALSILLQGNFEKLPLKVQDIINFQNSLVDPRNNFNKITLFIRKYFYLHSNEYIFQSVDIILGMIVCKAKNFTVFLTLKNPNVVYEGGKVEFYVVSIYPNEEGINWKRMNTQPVDSFEFLLQEFNHYVNSLICSDLSDHNKIENGQNEKMEEEGKNMEEEDGWKEKLERMRAFLDKYVVFVHKHVLVNKTRSSVTMGLYPFMNSILSNSGNKIDVYYWGQTVEVLDQCPTSFRLLTRPKLVIQYTPSMHKIVITHEPEIGMELDSSETLFSLINKVSTRTVKIFQNNLLSFPLSYCKTPKVQVSLLTGKCRLFDIGLPPSLVLHFETMLAIAITHENVLKTTMEDFEKCKKLATIHNVAMVHSQFSKLKEPEVYYLKAQPGESLIRGFPLNFSLSEVASIYVGIENGQIVMKYMINSEERQSAECDENVLKSFDDLYDFFFSKFESMLLKAYQTTFKLFFTKYFKNLKGEHFNVIERANNSLLITHVNIPFIHSISIKVNAETVTLFLSRSGINLNIENSKNGVYSFSIPRKYVDDDINTLMGIYAPFLHVLLFSYLFNFNNGMSHNEAEYTNNSVTIAHTLRINFVSTNPEKISMKCEVLYPNTQSSVTEKIKKRITFSFISDSLTIPQFTEMKNAIRGLNSHVLEGVVNHPMTTQTSYTLDIYNFFIYTFSVAPEGATQINFNSFYRVVHHFNRKISFDYYPFIGPFTETIFKSLPLKKDAVDETHLELALNQFYRVAYLSLVSLFFSSSNCMADQNNTFKSGQYNVSAPLTLTNAQKVIQIEPILSINDNTTKVIVDYFNTKFSTPFKRVSNVALFVQDYINVVRQDSVKELSVLPSAFFDIPQTCGFVFDFQIRKHKPQTNLFEVCLTFTLSGDNRTKILLSYRGSAWFVMKVTPASNKFNSNFVEFLRGVLGKQDRNRVSDGLVKIIDVFKANYQKF
ncbi:hypothetical protein EIN_498320 [Entamoeba invadens IP1]|uniref:Mediator of RNA polymerase II transcription subunit 14 n=1 Tax=Entamoeba invadens IP1 TaxID=370355 RepID=A0A0A1UDI5_ENTIV|nr:hypothetical protein EIN_498320 [Entamoeba invadens IP1]ELP94632.1 hypothetical protein EIN_498320 [Entamoeba invadens IP1]|eukprot:XP_004261403.1 hypothetical protein EIN_498320 [Entamoeba invadens IP1]